MAPFLESRMSMPNPLASLVRPDIAWRVGVTGTRMLAAESVPALSRSATDVLTLVRDEVARHGRMAEDCYNAGHSPHLRLLSPLAEGSDRLVAEAALSVGYMLEVPLPFAQADYEASFARSTAAFRALLARAVHTLELDGDRLADDWAYEAVGAHVVRNSDLLIAIWDGRPARGRGGTADVVWTAICAGLPVWWLPSNGTTPPRLLYTQHHLRELDHAPSGEVARAELREILGSAMRPSRAPRPIGQTAPGRLALRWYWRMRARSATMRGRLFANRCTVPSMPDDETSAPEPRGAVEIYWHNLHVSAATPARLFAGSFYFVQTLVGILALFAVICAASVFSLHVAAAPTATLELIFMATAAALAFSNRLRKWHDRWRTYYVLSDLYLKQGVVAALGWSLPNMVAEDLKAGAPLPNADWVAWRFNAARRAAPLPEGRFTEASVRRSRDLARRLLVGGCAQRTGRRSRFPRIVHWLDDLAAWVFLGGLCVLAISFALFRLGDNKGATGLLLSALFAAASAMYLGVRNVSDFKWAASEAPTNEP